MDSYDGAEICELVGLFIFNNLGQKFGKENIGLYRDDGLAIIHFWQVQRGKNSTNVLSNLV